MPTNRDKLIKYYNTLFLLPMIILFHSCIKQIEPPRWDIDALVPLAKSSLSVYDIITDTILQETEGDSLFIIFNEKLAPLKLDTILLLDVNPFIRNIKLDSIKLNDQHLLKSITLGEVITEQGYSALIHDSSTTFIPSINNVTSGPYLIDATDYFQSINLQEGVMDIKITNGFPVAINNINFELSNTDNDSIIHSGSFPDLPPGAADSVSVDLSGKTVDGRMDVTFSFDIAGSGITPVYIIYEDAVETEITIRDMQIFSATAIFPAQTILHHKEVVYLEDMDDMEITYGEIDSGKLRIRVVSTIEDITYFHYTIPNATKDGIAFEKYMTVPPAPHGESIEQEFFYPFSGYHFDFTGKDGDTINAFYNELIGRIDSTGEQVFLTLEDSVDVIVEVLDMQPSFARGYLGKEQIKTGLDTITFSAFNNFKIKSLDINNSEISIHINNQIGMNAALTIQHITGINTNTGNSVSLNTSSIPSEQEIGSAISYDPLVPKETIFEFNDKNANPSEFIGLLPDIISYSMDVSLNPDGKSGEYNDFLHTNKGINISVNAKIPLQIRASQLVLSDTLDILTNDTSMSNHLQDGVYYLLVNNGFPVEVYFDVFFLDNRHLAFDSLCFTEPVKPAPVDKKTMIVNDTAFSKLSFPVKGERMVDMINAHKVVIMARLNTMPSDKHLQFFSTYKLDIKLTADLRTSINYKLNDKQ
jgi:hypothetical protein